MAAFFFTTIALNVPRLPNPQSWARHLRLCSSANAVTRQGLGEVSAANGAGNLVLDDVGFFTGFTLDNLRCNTAAPTT